MDSPDHKWSVGVHLGTHVEKQVNARCEPTEPELLTFDLMTCDGC